MPSAPHRRRDRRLGVAETSRRLGLPAETVLRLATPGAVVRRGSRASPRRTCTSSKDRQPLGRHGRRCSGWGPRAPPGGRMSAKDRAISAPAPSSATPERGSSPAKAASTAIARQATECATPAHTSGSAGVSRSTSAGASDDVGRLPRARRRARRPRPGRRARPRRQLRARDVRPARPSTRRAHGRRLPRDPPQDGKSEGAGLDVLGEAPPRHARGVGAPPRRTDARCADASEPPRPSLSSPQAPTRISIDVSASGGAR